jgi:hypothetical protein
VARDAIARQYDVDKNSVKLDMEDVGGNYRPGTITFFAKKGKSINLDQIRESIKATRLYGKTQMQVTYLEVTATGEVTRAQKETMLRVKGTGQEFMLAEDANAAPGGGKTALQRLREALGRGEKVLSITGRVEGWSGRFPDVLRALEAQPANDGDKSAQPAPGRRPRLLVTDFETAKE